MLGHSNLSTTSHYLNVNRRGLHLAMQKFEESQKTSQQHQGSTPTDPRADAKSESVVQPLYKGAGSALASVQDAPPSIPATPVKPTLQ